MHTLLIVAGTMSMGKSFSPSFFHGCSKAAVTSAHRELPLVFPTRVRQGDRHVTYVPKAANRQLRQFPNFYASVFPGRQGSIIAASYVRTKSDNYIAFPEIPPRFSQFGKARVMLPIHTYLAAVTPRSEKFRQYLPSLTR